MLILEKKHHQLWLQRQYYILRKCSKNSKKMKEIAQSYLAYNDIKHFAGFNYLV